MEPSTARLRVHVEEWGCVPHSFTVVAAGLVAVLAAHPGVEVTWADAPLPPHWAALRAHPWVNVVHAKTRAPGLMCYPTAGSPW